MTYAGNSIFSSPTKQSSLDDIITTFEKIYDEFMSSESRRSDQKNESSSEILKPTENNPSTELEIVKNILDNLDFKKYRRRNSLQMEEFTKPFGLFRSLSFTSEVHHMKPNESDSASQRHDHITLENHDSCSPCKSPQEQRLYSKRRLRGPYGELLEEEMRKSGEKQSTQEVSQQNIKEDTRTHVVTEIFETEKSYVESLHVLVNVSI
nr:uncharacterized protein LOC122270898 isoform X2 [Parasteatoda tepidariorum]